MIHSNFKDIVYTCCSFIRFVHCLLSFSIFPQIVSPFGETVEPIGSSGQLQAVGCPSSNKNSLFPDPLGCDQVISCPLVQTTWTYPMSTSLFQIMSQNKSSIFCACFRYLCRVMRKLIDISCDYIKMVCSLSGLI